MDILNIANDIEKRLCDAGYCGKRLGSGCSMGYFPVRDFEYEYGEKRITQDVLDKIAYRDYKVTLKTKDNSFSIYVERLPQEISNTYGETWIETNEVAFELNKVITKGNSSKISIDFIAKVDGSDKEDENGTIRLRYILGLSGGLNGSGKWTNYLNDLNGILFKLEMNFDRVYLIDIKNDCADDIFYAKIALVRIGEKVDD